MLSSRFDFYFIKEVLAMIVLICIAIMAFIYIETEEDFLRFTSIFKKQLLAFCFIICFFSLLKLFFLLRGVKFDFLRDLNGVYPNGTSLVVDYNFYSLVNLLGIVTVFFLLPKMNSGKGSILLQFLVFFLMLNVFFSTSRRGIIVLALIILFVFLVFILGLVSGKKTWIAIFFRKLRLLGWCLFVSLLLMIIFLSQRPFHSKSSLYANLGFDQTTGRELLYLCVVRYYTILDPQYQDARMHHYFQSFRETGQIGSLNKLSEQELKTKIVNSSDSLKVNTNAKAANDYFTDILNDPENRFSGGRLQRVDFGIKIFSEQYSLTKKIIGGGFDYIWDFGHEFYKKNNNRFYFDYPHNPILSAFLYSGILGGLSLIYFFCMTFVNFFRGFKDLRYFICLYVIIFFFAFFSGDSIFGNPEFVFISLVPFYFTTLKYDESQKDKVIIKK
jgi:hypothetical protein